MMSLDRIKEFYPPSMRENTVFLKHILKEYVQLLILEFLSSTHYVRSVALIGGTNMRLVRGIDRFSEYLDFDCKDFSEEDFKKKLSSIFCLAVRTAGASFTSRNSFDRCDISKLIPAGNTDFPVPLGPKK